MPAYNKPGIDSCCSRTESRRNPSKWCKHSKLYLNMLIRASHYSHICVQGCQFWAHFVKISQFLCNIFLRSGTVLGEYSNIFGYLNISLRILDIWIWILEIWLFEYIHHRCRKNFTFWERGEALRKFLSGFQFSDSSRSLIRRSILENILDMEKFQQIWASSKIFS